MKKKLLQKLADIFIEKLSEIPNENKDLFKRLFFIGMLFNNICIRLNIYLD